MKRPPWRRLSFDGARFGWRVIHEHHVLPESPPLQGRCREVLVAAPEDRRASVLRLEFPDGPGREAGYPEAGVVWLSSGSRLEANLNLPRMARAAIEVALQSGWKPWGPRGWTTLDGWSLLEAIVRRYDELGRKRPEEARGPTGTAGGGSA
jgi:hypothetical protein